MRPFKPFLPEHPGAPWILDAFCGAGGASAGYWLAGFNVVGIDIVEFKRYPFELIVADAIEELRYLRKDGDLLGRRFVAIHASPPCQAFTEAWKIRQNDHPDLIAPTREILEEIGLPYIIENVEGAPLIDPITLCGAMFGLRTYRHRLFETSFSLPEPTHPPHVAKTTKMGRPPKKDEFMHVVGHFAGVPQAREAMGIAWMSRNELKEAIPPAYSEHIGLRIPLTPHQEAARALARDLRPEIPSGPQIASPAKNAGKSVALTSGLG
jgi:DNA (cytosine-5)-methyltransferase 1